MLLNGIDLTPYFRIKKVLGRGIIQNQLNLVSLSGSDGAFYQRKRRTLRELEIELNIIADDEFVLREKIDQLNGILSVEQPVPIVFPDEPTMTYYGIPATSDGADEAFFLHKGKLMIVCPDPNKYGEEIQLSFNAGALTLDNIGTAETKPVMDIVMTSASSDLVISNGTESLRLIFGFVSTDEITIDFKKRKVFINGNIHMATVDLNNANFFTLKRGVNTLTITPSATATLTYKEAWK